MQIVKGYNKNNDKGSYTHNFFFVSIEIKMHKILESLRKDVSRKDISFPVTFFTPR